MNALERAAQQSRWARRNVGEKAVLLFGLLLLALLLPVLGVVLVGVSVLALAVCAGVPWRLYVTLVFAPATFIILGTIPLIVGVSLDGMYLIPHGFSMAVVLSFRAVVATSATMLFAVTTPMSEQIAAAARAGFSPVIVSVVALMYRMVGTLMETARTMHSAQAARLGYSSKRHSLHSTAGLASSLFVVAFLRARRMEEGLALRAPQRDFATLSTPRPVHGRRLALSVLLLMLLPILSIGLQNVVQ